MQALRAFDDRSRKLVAPLPTFRAAPNFSLCAGYSQTGALQYGKCHGVMMSEDNGAPFTCHECGLLATRRGYEVRIDDRESDSRCKHGQTPQRCPSLKEAASIARQFAAIQGRY
jgi:hypothetical protein